MDSDPSFIARLRSAWAARRDLFARRSELWRQRPRLAPVYVGAFGVLLIYLTLGMLHVGVMKTYQSGDERRHVAYAVELADGGEWPKVTDPLPAKKLHEKKGGNMAAATHPPLYYWYVGTVLDHTPNMKALARRIFIARAMTVLLGAVGLVYVLRIGRLLFPRHDAIALAMMTIVGMLPGFINISALVNNDILGAFTAYAAFHGALRILMLGPTPWRVISAAFWMSLAPFSKLSGGIVVGPALLLAFIGLIWHLRGGWLRRLAIASAVAAAMLGAVVAVSGWFYLRNYRLYGDLTGSTAFLPLFKRKPNASTFTLITSLKPWATFFQHLWVRLAGGIDFQGALRRLPSALCAIPLLGAVKAAVHVWLARKRIGEIFSRKMLTGVTLGWVAFGCLMLAMFMYHSKGGSMNARYSLAVIWVPALVLAIGMASVRSPALMQWSLASFVVSTLVITETYAHAIFRKQGIKDFAIANALSRGKASHLGDFTLLALGLVCLGLVLLLWAVARTHRRIDTLDDAVPAPSVPS